MRDAHTAPTNGVVTQMVNTVLIDLHNNLQERVSLLRWLRTYLPRSKVKVAVQADERVATSHQGVTSQASTLDPQHVGLNVSRRHWKGLQ